MTYDFTRTGPQIQAIHDTVDNIYNTLGNTNLLSNHNFLIASPDNITHPSATPTDYLAGTQIFSNIFVATDITGLTLINGRLDWASGSFYMPVSNSGALEYANELTASVADFDGNPRTRGVSFSLIGDEYRVTVDVDALEDSGGNATPLGSVKFEQGGVATSHEIGSLSSGNLSDYTTFDLQSIYAMEISKIGFKVGDRINTKTDGVNLVNLSWVVTDTGAGDMSDGTRTLNNGLYARIQPNSNQHIDVGAWDVYTLADATNECNTAIEYGRINSYQPVTSYSFNSRGLDLSESGRSLIGLNSRPEYNKVEINIIGSPILDNGNGDSVGVLLNNDATSTKRNIQLKGVTIREGSDNDPSAGMRHWGIYGHGIPQHDIQEVLIYGFEKSICTWYHWNSTQNEIHCYNYRDYGYCLYDPNSLNPSLNNVNGPNLGAVHATGSVSAKCNFDLRSANSVGFAVITSEGSPDSHFLMDANTRNITVQSIHLETGGNIIEYDLSAGTPSAPRTNIEFLGGGFFDLGAVAGTKFVNPINSGAFAGIASLTIGGGVTMSKNEVCPTDFFDMSKVAVLNQFGTMEFRANAADQITFFNVATGLARTQRKGQFGHDGLQQTSLNKGIYTGVPGASKTWKSFTPQSLSNDPIFINENDGREWTYYIDVKGSYNVPPFDVRAFWARFAVHKLPDNTLVTTIVSDEDLYAIDTTFTVNAAGTEIEASNSNSFLEWYFMVEKVPTVLG